MAETGALFGARHYRAYHFLLTLSDHVAHFGLEHHESSDDREAEKYLIDPDLLKLSAGLLPHEMTHSWNGKYRRPAGLATPDYQQPMKDELLWVYEGLTEYLGKQCSPPAAASGPTTTSANRSPWMPPGWTDEPGRTWRPARPTPTVAAQLLYDARKEGNSWRRGVDFYPEGALIWLEADVLIRQQTQGRRSLDDFCSSSAAAPAARPTCCHLHPRGRGRRAERRSRLYDWRQFFQERIYDITPARAPGRHRERRLAPRLHQHRPPPCSNPPETAHKFTDLRFSLGLILTGRRRIQDVIPGSPADQAGVGVGNEAAGRQWPPLDRRTSCATAIQAAATTNTAPIELLVENDDYFKTCKVDYHEGDKYP